ncbi:Rv3654c family TadE-like protein [Rhodococcus sp. HNM0569]|uniref:Rv3654c family TadE-like protein n=1 Tax=Rhodococcus sp. HNM0569 TaxID=2716340 RepID=UPI00146AE789|nr:Rv3654c family TadE-like protein [Rhodococcus sp. HNM0569]NLU83355.1 flp pilus-assembly TadE/G-like family protein [Rhodococcus sp. HNM0569]
MTDATGGERTATGLRCRGDAGGAAIVGAFAAAVLVAVTAGVVHVGAAVAARHRAQAAADLSAIAGAYALDRGIEVACGRAESLAETNGATVDECRVDGWTVTVEVTADVPWVGRTAHATARAGPVE